MSELNISVVIMQENMLISRKIHTTGKNFTLPPAVTAVTNITSVFHQTFLSVCVAILGTDATNYTCVVLDFICNMFLLFKYVFFVFICRRS